METQYKPIPYGHCGNEDCGQMSSWYIFSSLGFYPVNAAEGLYVIGTPLWESASIELKDGKSFKITCKHASTENLYINSVKLNGKALDRSFIYHDEIMKGGHLEFEMSAKPNKELWTEQSSYPPSDKN
jgi:putative alpha-1,2-mannosidase